MVEGTVVYDLPLLLEVGLAAGMFYIFRLMLKMGDTKVPGCGWVGHD